VVPTNENLGNDEFQDMVEYATQRGIRLNVNLPAPIGKWANFTSCALTAVSIKKLESNFFPLPNFVSDFKNTNLSGKMHCPMGENNVYVFPDGEVCPCTFTHISFGNILQESAQTILKRMDSSPTLQNIKRDGMCPISMDKDFIAKVHGAINSSNHYPPRAEDVGF